MVTYRFLYDRWIRPQREKLQQEAWKEGWAEGWAQGWAEGQREIQRQWEDWLRRREEAERQNLPFREAPPRATRADHCPGQGVRSARRKVQALRRTYTR